MSALKFCSVAMLTMISVSGYCQDHKEGAKHWGQGVRSSETQLPEWRAKREARAGKAAAIDAATSPSVSDNAQRRGGSPTDATVGGAQDGETVWLSDAPPPRGDGTRAGVARWGGNTGGDRSGPPMKRLWLRSGTDPLKAGFAREDANAPNEILIVTPQGNAEGQPLPPTEEGGRSLAFEMPVQGYYRLYVTTRKAQGDILNISVAKAEITNFSHGGDEEERTKAMEALRVLASAPIEIVRDKTPNEKLSFQLRSGDEQSFVVLRKGLPLQGARVRFVSHQGWVKEAVSDEQGRVRFQVVRDYFPPWREFQKRFKAAYLLIAEATATETGRHLDQPYSSVRYQTTLSGSYYPSPDDYRSYAWGLGVCLSLLLFSGTAVYLHRRRRVKPFREVRFHETN